MAIREITPQDLSDLDRRFVLHPFSPMAGHEAHGPRRMIVGGEGTTVVDDQGRRYLDAMAGLWCVNVGYGRTELAEAMQEQARRLPYYHGFSSMATDTPARLAERLIELAPAGMSKVFFGLSGSDANDTQIKLVHLYNNLLGRPRKKKIISRLRGYHGVSLGSGGLTGLPSLHRSFDLPLPFVRHASAPHRLWDADPAESDAAYVERLARELERQILAEDPDTVAAFIAEPIQAAGGVIVPPDGYFPAIQEVLRRYDVLMIADEVVCGFGRIGSWFGSEALKLEPDLITVAKGLTSAYFPLSGCIVSEKVWDVLGDPSRDSAFVHGFTYTAHPVGAAVALANLDLVEQGGLGAQAVARGERLRSGLAAKLSGAPFVADIRGRGLLAAVEFAAGTEPLRPFAPVGAFSARVTAECLERGVITRALPEADTISFSPPFVITEAEIDEIVEVVGDAVQAASSDPAFSAAATGGR